MTHIRIDDLEEAERVKDNPMRDIRGGVGVGGGGAFVGVGGGGAFVGVGGGGAFVGVGGGQASYKNTRELRIH